MRISTIDGFRGIFLVFMMVIHANDILHTTFGKLNHHSFGWVEDAQGFVFMSGLVVGLVYGGRYLRKSYEDMRGAIWARIRTIYSHQIGLVLIFLTAALLFVQFGQTPPGVLDPYANSPMLFTALAVLLLTGSYHMGILPMYIFFMMLTPFAMRLLHAQRYYLYATLIFACWALAQTQVVDFSHGLLEKRARDYGFGLGIFFNILGWQALFFGGLFIGFLMASKRLQTDFLSKPEMKTVFYICVALFFFYGIYDRIIFDNWFGNVFSESIKAQTDRGNLSTIYVITFAVDLFIVVWLLGPGQTDATPLVRGVATILHRIANWQPLVFLGQHSLHVFSAHILIVYTIAVFFEGNPPSEIIGIAVILGSLGILYCVAVWHARSVAAAKA